MDGRRVVGEKHVLTDCVADGPCDEVHGDGEGLFGLAGDVPVGCVSGLI
jgi:hypothetical protein